MLKTTLSDGTGSGHEAQINDQNELCVAARVTPVDYEPTGVPWVNQVGKMRTSEVISRFEGRFFYGLNNDFWQSAANVNGSRVYLFHTNGVSLEIPGNAGDKYYDITKTIFFYQPDTVVHASTALAFQVQRGLVEFWGLVSYQGGKIRDGYLLRIVEGDVEFVKISSASGTPIETIHPRKLWYDPMDGSGPSGLSLDFEAIQMVKIDHAWYGAGSANLSFRYKNKVYLADTFVGANQGSKEPIIANPNLSVMYGIEASRQLPVPGKFTHYGLSVGADGDLNVTGKPFGVASGNKTVSGGIWTPILSIRLKTLFSIDGATPKPNVYGYITDVLLSVFVTGRDTQIAFVRNSALTGASFGSIPSINGTPVTDSMVEYDVSATTITGGLIMYPRTLANNGYVEINVTEQDVISVDSLGLASTTLTVVARPSAGGNATVNAALSWREAY